MTIALAKAIIQDDNTHEAQKYKLLGALSF